MSVGFFGIQFAWAIQMGQMSGLYERLGARPEQISWLWIAGPITGMLVQPVIGHMSDRTRGRWGRRRPYFLAGAVLSSLALLAMPNSPGLWAAASLLWILDASINISMEPFRALVADLTPESQRGMAYSFQSFAIGLGSVLSFGIGGMMSLKPLFYIGSAVFLAAIAWTVLTTQEKPLEQEPVSGRSGMWAWVGETWDMLGQMPENMRRLCLVHSLTWFGFFCLFIFFSPMVAAKVFGAAPNTPEYDRGIAWASWCYLALNVVCFLSSLALGRLTQAWPKRRVHAMSLILGGCAMAAIALAKDRYSVMAAMALLGVCWASTLSLPYALLSGSVPAERYGLFMGAFNIFICLPQIVCSLVMGPVVAAAGGDKALAMLLGGVSLILAAGAMRWVKESA